MATEDLLVGRTLEGRYRILERIARGGMSTVYSAVDERLDRLVAVKVMSSALSTDPAFSDRFTREARAAARLTHLNTVAVYDQGAETGPDGHHVFLVMELVHGRTLRDLIRERSAPFPPAEAISIIQPVLSALSAAHAAGIVHRDVKPENILLSDDGVVKVADFGLARAVEADASSTRTGLMMGTVAYCAPEQITKGEADPRSDVYAAGIVLFELLTGRPPFQGESAMNVAYQHVNGRVPAPSSKVRGIPSEVDELVVLATDPDRDERPVDAGEFLAEIADVRERLHLPIVPVPTRPAAARRGRAAARGNADADTTALVGGGGSHDTKIVRQQLGAMKAPAQPAGRPQQRGDGPPPPVVIPPSRRKQLSPRQRRRRRGLIVLLVVLVLGLAAGAAGWWFASGRFSTVPSVSGDTQAQARQAIESAGFDYAGVAESQYSETVPAGDVMATKPRSGSRHVHGTDISLVVSLGPQRIGVPDVRNQSAEDAAAAIKKVGLPDPQVVTQHSTHVDNGKAIKTVPAAGKKVRKTTVVKLYISLGPPIVSVPDIAPGTSYHDAVAALESAHLNPVRGAAKYSDSVPKGTVISVSPNDRATEFSNVTIIVSRGPRMVTVPDIARGSSATDAKAQLEGMNLKVDLEPFLPFAGTDHVYSVDPGPGQSVPVGSTVTITTY
ncbi:MAG TPA: Stk1 family PASTA domain-containing Ser/Thr kinase [Jatrophihabitantaceae bacterium]|nr:Stk1 family PASTA domain-containing Ser/Thr kinase [Jatrophihabitantaceae bacterium]